MSSPAEVPVPDITFNGVDGSECEAFVVTIRDYAFATGRERDRYWMLHFATTRLRGKALRWHARLEPSIQEDWHLFVQALFDQYPLVEEPGCDEVATPVWSATTFSPGQSTVALPPNPEADRNLAGQKVPSPPTRQYDTSKTGQQIGLLRIVNADEEETSIPQYVWRDYSEQSGSTQIYSAMATINRHEALLVSFLPSSESHTVGCLNSRLFRTLALQWNHSGSEPEYFTLYNYSDVYGFTTPAASTFGYVGKAWNVLADGTLQASLSWSGKYEETKFTTTEVHVDASGAIIRFVKPGTLLEQDKPKGSYTHPFFRARIVFEPL